MRRQLSGRRATIRHPGVRPSICGHLDGSQGAKREHYGHQRSGDTVRPGWRPPLTTSYSTPPYPPTLNQNGDEMTGHNTPIRAAFTQVTGPFRVPTGNTAERATRPSGYEAAAPNTRPDSAAYQRNPRELES